MKKMPIKVCIVDDSPEVRESVVDYITSAQDFECVGAFETGEEALKSIPGLQPAVVLMDINLPCMSHPVCAEIKGQDAKPSSHDVDGLREHGANISGAFSRCLWLFTQKHPA